MIAPGDSCRWVSKNTNSFKCIFYRWQLFHQQDKHYLCIMASDTPDQNLAQYFPVCNDFIHAARLRDGNVLIHCLAGMSRSVTVAVAYIMSVTQLSWREALKVVRTGRSVANPNFGFQMQLQDYELYKLHEVSTLPNRNQTFQPKYRTTTVFQIVCNLNLKVIFIIHILESCLHRVSLQHFGILWQLMPRFAIIVW